MLKFTSIVGYTSCGATYIESFFTIFGQCINVLNYNNNYVSTHWILSNLGPTDRQRASCQKAVLSEFGCVVEVK